MHNGFSFNGVHCSKLGCTYVPSADEKISLPNVSATTSEIAQMDGGYYYGSKYKTRTFSLKCFFEDLTMERIHAITRWLSKDSLGKLVFDERPTVYYRVRPTGKFVPTMYAGEHEWMNE